MKSFVGLGTWRFFLAFLVVISHLWSDMIHGPAAYAVWGFFVLSGYLMTHVLCNKYGFTGKGITSYAYNRFLRIMPLYYLSVLLGIFTIYSLVPRGIDLLALNGQFAMPQGWNWAFLVTLLPIFPMGGNPVPVSGALGVEVGAYVLMPLLAKSRSAAWLAVIFGVLINLNYGFDMATFSARYSLFLPCIIAFAVGSLASHYKEALKRFSFPFISLIGWCLHGLIWLKYPYYPWTYGLYVSIILSAWVVISLASQKPSATDKALGDMSYPIYLIHTTVAAWFIGYFGYDRSFAFFIVSLVATLVISFILIRLVDRNVYSFKKPAVLKSSSSNYEVMKL